MTTDEKLAATRFVPVVLDFLAAPIAVLVGFGATWLEGSLGPFHYDADQIGAVLSEIVTFGVTTILMFVAELNAVKWLDRNINKIAETATPKP